MSSRRRVIKKTRDSDDGFEWGGDEELSENHEGSDFEEEEPVKPTKKKRPVPTRSSTRERKKYVADSEEDEDLDEATKPEPTKKKKKKTKKAITEANEDENNVKMPVKLTGKRKKSPQKIQESEPPAKKRSRNVKEDGSGADTDEAKRLTKKHFNGTITVAITGAREGDMVEGCAADTQNVVLRVEQGTISAPAGIRRSVEAHEGRDAVVQMMAKQFGMSVSQANMRYNDCPVIENVRNSQPLGQACTHSDTTCDCEPAARFVILNQGVWQNFAEEHGHGEQLKEMVQRGLVVCYKDILRTMQTPGQPGGKTLILRPKLFKICVGPVTVDETTLKDKNKIVDASAWITAGDNGAPPETKVWEIDQTLFRLPVSARSAPTKDELGALILKSLQGLIPERSLSELLVQSCIDALRALTVGGLKSLLQKVIRFHAEQVDCSLVMGPEAPPLPVALVAATSAGLLFTEAGNFSPELQLYTRGCTSALKRMAVILVEDSWVHEAESSVLGLLALALATQRMAEYHPPQSVVVETMRLAAKAALSPCLIAWRKQVAPKNPKTVSVDKAGIRALKQSAVLLRIVKSFPGDMDMMDSVAGLAKTKGCLTLTRCLPANRLSVMPLFHCVDQHTYRGVGHVGPSGPTFTKKFQTIFGSTTGFNPRHASSEGFEAKAAVKETRFAQRCVARFAFHVPLATIPAQPETVTFQLSLDSGTLAAAAGPIPVKIKIGKATREVLVILGVRCPEDEVVMMKPARATRDLFGSLTDEQRANAIAEARKQTITARSPVLKSAKTISFRDGCWQLDEKPWNPQEGRTLVVPLVEEPVWASVDGDGVASALRSDAALEESLTKKAPAGLVPAAETLIGKLAASAGDAVTLRAISMLRQQYVKVTLPTPALDGGLGSDQLVAYKGDWEVFRLLALVARFAPGALRPGIPPNFAVVDANLLRLVERWMIRGMRAKDEQVLTTNKWANNPLWRGMASAEQKLMEHQRCAVESMKRRDREAGSSNHYLIMDTGVGKTVTSLCYLYRWLLHHGQNVTKVIWVTPKGTVDNLIKQLQMTWSAPVWKVPRLSTAKKPKPGDGDRLILKDYHINVIHADHLRGMIDFGLTELAPASVIVFDEVDELYAPTLRTSAARRLAQLCAKFVAQTATPMRRNESQLMAWLSDTCSFPVDVRNLLVAASGMVSIQLELGIASKEELNLVPMSDTVRKSLRELLVKRRWLPMAQLVQQHTNAAMVEQAVKLAVEDRKKHRDGGVLMVADTKDHAEKLIAACNARGKVRAGGFDTLEASNAAEYGIVVVPKDKDRGYNSAVRLGSMVTGVYAGNGASRHQMRGRLRRLGQKRKVVHFHTVVMENSLLHLLHIRHDAVDSMNISLQELGDKFSADVLMALDRSER
ncbi:expressed unknown protein [Seminavis robusta]|uniref:Helicase ATP-binding domain-containing protein n=1 Tax=Seminavis robusta TaxID=568900 RepID=A0A9N8EJ29_9STRA|nr:expressed unknown protein [Seminavis robusta]|eukprot:Sro1036_g234070.1 n/a (1388) ;mRNA; f:25053-29284